MEEKARFNVKYMEEMKLYTHEEMLDRVIGTKGTPAREKYETDIKTDCCAICGATDCPCGRPAVPVLPVLLPPDSGLGHHGSAGRGTVLHQLPDGRRHLSGDCVPAFPLWLAGGGGRCYYGAEQLKPVSAAIHHKLIASGQVVPK